MRAQSELDELTLLLVLGKADVQHFFHGIESFNYKLEILRLKFMLKRFTLKDDIKSNMDEAGK